MRSPAESIARGHARGALRPSLQALASLSPSTLPAEVMSPDTAEMAIVDAVGAPAPLNTSVGAPAAAPSPELRGTRTPGRAPTRSGGRRALLGGAALALRTRLGSIEQERIVAMRDTWRALWSSRVLVWLAGAGTVATVGFGPARNAFDPPGVTRGFGWLGDLLAAPAARWDAAWYLVIAHLGYAPALGPFTSARDAFFPLYPLGLRALSDTGLPPVLAGVLLSLLSLALALYWIHRLTALEFGDWALARGATGADVARLAVLATALAPMAFYFSAVYSESLYLALSVGVFWFARAGRWRLVALLGALAAATRSTGVVLLLPALMLYLYGPREDLAPVRRAAAVGAATAAGARGLRALVAGLRPRYPLRRDILWLALIPAGLLLYLAYLGFAGGDALAPFRAQHVWGRHFAGPYLGVWDGVKAAFEGARQLLSAQRAHAYYPIAGGSPFIAAGHNLMLLAFLVASVPLLVAVVRLLPAAYGAYTFLALALPLSYPVAPQPLMSLPRFLVALFPLGMVLGAWLLAHPRARAPVLGASAIAMMVFCAQFATWHWVA